MANRERQQYKHRNNRYIDRQNTKIDSILRITYALNRDINKIIGKTEDNNSFDGLDKDIKLDIISKTLLEMRDKLETYSQTQQNSKQPIIQPNQNNPFANQMPFNSYPFIPRIMF